MIFFDNKMTKLFSLIAFSKTFKIQNGLNSLNFPHRPILLVSYFAISAPPFPNYSGGGGGGGISRQCVILKIHQAYKYKEHARG
jgi:hypothetical protein